MPQNKAVDVVIIGAGWAGGIMAAELTKAGLSVVALERGHARTMVDYQHAHDELRYSLRYEMMQNTALETCTLRHNLSERALPIRQLGSFLPGTGVGGAGVHWNGQTWRFHPHDFTIYSDTLARYGAKKLPEETTIQDWGLTYTQLEPYYDKFEYMAGIAGKAGNIQGELQAGGNPFEGPRSREYPVPPMKDAHGPSVFRDAASKLGYHPFPSPSANLSQVYTNPDGISRGSCMYCGFCETYGCEVGAKADPVVTVLPVALQSGHFELRTEANVFSIQHDGQRATGVLYYDAQGVVQEQPAQLVVLTAYTFNNVRLLLLSQMGTPYNPQTGQGVVGKNYCYQTVATGAGFFDSQTFHRYMGSGANGYTIDDFNADNFDHSKLDFIGGGSISCYSTGARPIQSLPVPTGTPSWGAQWKKAIRQYYDHVISLQFLGESLAYRTHYLDLDPTYRDAWGNPLLRITFDWQPQERQMVAFAGAKMHEILQAAGASKFVAQSTLPDHYSVVTYQSTHNTGGAIIGNDPATSVVNSYCQMWDFENVFVIGASAFPQNAGFNPTGTVGALAYRAADGIVHKYLRSGGLIV